MTNQTNLELAGLQRLAEFEPNVRIVCPLPTGECLGLTRYVRKAYGRVSKPYEGLEEFAWLYEVWTPAFMARDAAWPHIKDRARGWHVLPLGAPGEAEALRLLKGEPYDDIVNLRAPVRGVGR